MELLGNVCLPTHPSEKHTPNDYTEAGYQSLPSKLSADKKREARSQPMAYSMAIKKNEAALFILHMEGSPREIIGEKKAKLKTAYSLLPFV